MKKLVSKGTGDQMLNAFEAKLDQLSPSSVDSASTIEARADDISPEEDAILEKYLPDRGEGDTMAQQIVTAVNKLIYKWYNDGDVFDNVHSYCSGWANDLSDYANWLYEYANGAIVLDDIYEADEAQYEDLLEHLKTYYLNEDMLSKYAEKLAVGSIYDCDGPYEFSEEEEDEDDYYDDDYDEDEDDIYESTDVTAASNDLNAAEMSVKYTVYKLNDAKDGADPYSDGSFVVTGTDEDDLMDKMEAEIDKINKKWTKKSPNFYVDDVVWSSVRYTEADKEAEEEWYRNFN